ncbi:MAG: acetyl-CoA carboxylase biotin carboxyl carrier protein [Ignavibacteriaceae bacterium]|nr:acetyl-CoA carboxylase biotin carboxyl carrier protein [Bacteroidota bacterium]MCH7774607.1 acetyl-CoA carboxylase biotin carboxyl carrier protein [Bacteroidota bacterium]
MDLNLIRKLVKIVDTSGITDLEIEEDGLRIKVAKKIRNNQLNSQPQMVVQTESVEGPSSPAAVTGEKTPAEKSEEPTDNFHKINSPIVGTFYRAPAPDADPYVQVGDSVSPGTVLCVVEAMKLMNEIESDVSGKVLKILVENGKPVEYNQPLFFIEPN